MTVLMAPVLVVVYWRLALREERELEARFGDRYRTYKKQVPAFLPASATWRRLRLAQLSEPGKS